MYGCSDSRVTFPFDVLISQDHAVVWLQFPRVFHLGINYTKLHLCLLRSGYLGVKMQRDAEEILMAGKAGYKLR